MIRFMLRPFMKKFIGLFISMAFVSMLAIGLLSAFVSTIYNLQNTLETYLHDYEDVNAVAEFNLTTKSDINEIRAVEGVADVEFRLSLNAFLQKPIKKEDGTDGYRTLTVRLCTFKEDNTSLFNRYVIDKCDKSDNLINVSVIRKFAVNNGFKVGDTIKIGYMDMYVECFINEIIEVPEAMQARLTTYVWSDNSDFGFLYFSDNELNKAIDMLATNINNKLQTDDVYKEYYESIKDTIGKDFPDIVNEYVVNTGALKKIANQALIKAKNGYREEEVVYYVKEYLESKEITVKSVTENHNLFYYIYIQNAIRQLRVAAIFLPVFFYAVTMIVIGLFVNQIIKTMTPQIGVMMSIGGGKRDIISIFMSFTLMMSIVAGILGASLGIGLNYMLAGVMIKVYSIPTIPLMANPVIVVLSVISLMIFAQIATIISCRAIFKITPKDATISNEAKRKPLPKWLSKTINNSPMIIKLGINSIAQNPRRFFVSVFSIFASYVIILLSLLFYVGKGELINQTLETRLKYDAQVYMIDVATPEATETAKNDASVKDFLDCYYTYVEITDITSSKKSYLECLAYDHTVQNNMFVIPDEKGENNLKISETGIILPHSIANAIGAKVGDAVLVNKVPVRIIAISKQYAHPAGYMSKVQMEKFKTKYVSSYLVKVNNEADFLEHMSKQNASLTVFTRALKKDMSDTFNSIDIFIYLLIGFSLGMGFIILCIMGQNALMEQKRQISIFRLIGFTVLDVSKLWLLQSLAQFVISTIFAIPAGIGAAAILFKITSSVQQIYPVVISAPAILFAIGFILLIIVASHMIEMISIKRWNLADNTRTRE